MFKKNTWVVGLLVVLAIMFAGCIDPAEDEGGAIVEVFRLSKVIADVEDGLLDGDEAFSAVFKDTPIQKCGGLNFSIITDKGVKKLKLDGMTQTWGEGLDLYNASDAAKKITGVGFRAGDKITIKGSADPVGIFLNSKGGSYGATDNWQSDTVEFDHTTTLDATMVGTIRSGSPQVIRIHYHDGKGDSRKGVIIFEEIVVEGSRSGETDVFADDFEVTGTVQEANWVTGVKITPKAGKSNGNITTYYTSDLPVDEDSVWDTVIPQTVGVYGVKFDVARVEDKFKAATDLDGGTMQVFAVLPTTSTSVSNIGDTWPGFAFEGTGATRINMPGGNAFVFLYNNPGDISAALPTQIQSFSVGGTPRIVYQMTQTNWRAYKEVVITYNLIKCKISAADSTNIIVRNNSGATYDNKSGDTYPDLEEGKGKKLVLPISRFGTDSDGFSFTKNHGGSAVLIRITDITYNPY